MTGSLGRSGVVELLMPWVAGGQLSLAEAMRTFVRTRAPDVFSALESEDVRLFLEPFGFVYATQGLRSPDDLALCYAGVMRLDTRPVCLVAVADSAGRVFLPGAGFLGGLAAGDTLVLQSASDSPVGYKPTRGSYHAVRLSDFAVGQTTQLAYPVAALASVVQAEGGALAGLEVASMSHRATLVRAWPLLADSWPPLAALIGETIRHVVLFEDSTRNSFAAEAAHGIVFLNVAHGTSESFLIEDLVHQGGHALFTAACEGAGPLFTIPAETPLEEVIGVTDHRTLDIALHGLVTQSLMVSALDRILAIDAPIDQHEATGRLLFALMRLGLDLRALAAASVFSQQGTALVRALVSDYTAAAERYGTTLMTANFEGQGYNFDYTAYRAHNPSGVARAS